MMKSKSCFRFMVHSFMSFIYCLWFCFVEWNICYWWNLFHYFIWKTLMKHEIINNEIMSFSSTKPWNHEQWNHEFLHQRNHEIMKNMKYEKWNQKDKIWKLKMKPGKIYGNIWIKINNEIVKEKKSIPLIITKNIRLNWKIKTNTQKYVWLFYPFLF